MSADDFQRFDKAAARIERLLHWQVAVIMLTAAGVLWGARLEWNQSAHDARLSKHDVLIDKLMDLTGDLKSNQALQRQLIETLKERHSSQSNKVDVKVGAMAGPSEELIKAAKLRGYFTTADVGVMMKRDAGTVADMCSAGKLPGAWRDKDAGSAPWKIPLALMLGAAETGDSQSQPQTASVSRKQPEGES